MIIRVDTLENLVADTAQYLGKEKEELLQDIQDVNFRMGDASGYKYISDNKKEQIDEVYLCHVARKLDTDHNMKLFPLKKVLTTENAFSDLNEARFSNIFIEKRASSCPQSLEKSRLFSYPLLMSEGENSQNVKRIFLRKVVI